MVFVYRLVLGLPSYLSFIIEPRPTLSLGGRIRLAARIHRISYRVTCAHDEVEAMAMIRSIFDIPAGADGVIVEAGCFKGGSTAKLSLAAKLTGRKLLVFDSFAGIPDNDETHGPTGEPGPVAFLPGTYAGRLEEVKANVAREGDIGSCEFIKGWFDDTMPGFNRPVAMIFLDVDLASSTRTCLKHLYPKLRPGGVLYSHDAALSRVQEVFADEQFWRAEFNQPAPSIDARLSETMMRIQKPAASQI